MNSTILRRSGVLCLFVFTIAWEAQGKFALTLDREPVSQTALVGASVTFSVVVHEPPRLHRQVYQWFFNGLPIPGATNSVFTLPNVEPGDEGNYSAVASIQRGSKFFSAASSNAFLNVLVPPFIISSPADQTVCAGETVSFNVSAGGEAPLSYQWHFNGSPIADATNDMLTLANVQPGSAGLYSVRVSNPHGTATTSPAALVVRTAPGIVAHPQSQTAPVGATLTLSVSADGSLPLSYQWFKDGFPLDSQTNASLVLSAVPLSASGNYFVLVLNNCGMVASATAVLTVLVPPEITQSPLDMAVCAGSDVTLMVAATGNPPLRYQWRVGDSDIAGATNESFTLTNAQAADTGLYRVRVSNPAGAAESLAAIVFVVAPPAIVVEPQSQAAAAGSTVTLSVGAEGGLPLAYQWFHNGLALPNESLPMLVLSPVSLTDQGAYTVVVTNLCGSVTSVVAVITVGEPPQVVELMPGNTDLVFGDQLLLSLRLIATPPVTNIYSINGLPVATNVAFPCSIIEGDSFNGDTSESLCDSFGTDVDLRRFRIGENTVTVFSANSFGSTMTTQLYSISAPGPVTVNLGTPDVRSFSGLCFSFAEEIPTRCGTLSASACVYFLEATNSGRVSLGVDGTGVRERTAVLLVSNLDGSRTLVADCANEISTNADHSRIQFLAEVNPSETETYWFIVDTASPITISYGFDPRFESITVRPEGVELTSDAGPPLRYKVEAAPDPDPSSSWSEIWSTNLSLADPIISYVDSDATNHVQRYYRIRPAP